MQITLFFIVGYTSKSVNNTLYSQIISVNKYIAAIIVFIAIYTLLYCSIELRFKKSFTTSSPSI